VSLRSLHFARALELRLDERADDVRDGDGDDEGAALGRPETEEAKNLLSAEVEAEAAEAEA